MNASMTFHLFKLFHPGSSPSFRTFAIYTRGTKTSPCQPAIFARSLVGLAEGTDMAAFICRLTRPMVAWERNAGIANCSRRYRPTCRMCPSADSSRLSGVVWVSSRQLSERAQASLAIRRGTICCKEGVRAGTETNKEAAS